MEKDTFVPHFVSQLVMHRRALRNLMESTPHHSGAAGFVRQVDANAEMLIGDDGPGMPERNLEMVFDPFTQLET